MTRAKAQAASSSQVMTMFTIYRPSREFPYLYCLRKVEVSKRGTRLSRIACVHPEPKALARPFVFSMAWMPRHPTDDPAIVGTFM